MLRQASRAGVPPTEFWSLTPRELFHVTKVRQAQEIEHRNIAAWAGFVAASGIGGKKKKIRYSDYQIGPKDLEPPKPVDEEEAAERMRRLQDRMGPRND